MGKPPQAGVGVNNPEWVWFSYLDTIGPFRRRSVDQRENIEQVRATVGSPTGAHRSCRRRRMQADVRGISAKLIAIEPAPGRAILDGSRLRVRVGSKRARPRSPERSALAAPHIMRHDERQSSAD